MKMFESRSVKPVPPSCKKTPVFLMIAGATIAAMAAVSCVALAGQTVTVGTKASSPKAIGKIDHSAWDALLRKYVDEDGFVNYRAWKASSKDRRQLTAYLSRLSEANPNLPSSRDAKLAFWINAYNAVTIHGILREYPTSSIRKHTSKLGGYNIWDDLHLIVGNRTYSLNDMEHKILRKMGEPRIHFAIVCASISCPRLLNQAYTPGKVQKQLELNAKDFFKRSGNFRYDRTNGRFYLSAILDWFGQDFGKNQSAQLKTIAQWLPSEAAQSAAVQNRVRITYLDYNWGLNDQASK